MQYKFTLILGALFLTAQLNAQTAREVGVEIKANLNSSKHIELKWLQQSGSTRYQVFTKNSSNTGWDRLADLSGSDTSFTDTAYKIGTRKEYRVARTSSNYTGFDGNGYILAGFDVPAKESLGRVLLLIEDKYKSTASPEIKKYILQLLNEGYQVDTHYVSTTENPPAVKSWIYKQWQKDTTQPTSIFLLGRIPVPYSGNMRPDGHLDHLGAWPADMYYGCFYVNWTDNSVNNTAATYSRNHNVPNDGKFDISRLNTATKTIIDYCQLPVGRVDLTDMPSFGNDTQLIKRYLNKAMLFRTGERKAQNRGLIDDNFGYFGSEAFASGGYRNISVFSAQAPSTQDYITELKSKDYLLSYGCGAGTYTSCGGVASSSDFVNDSLLNPFTMTFGSYYGDWDNSDNFLRAPLASKGWGLSSVWSGRPYWMMHSCAQGYPLADAVLRTYNTWNIYNAAAWMSGVHTALMGDPTLRMLVVDNVHNLSVTSNCNEEVIIKWGHVNDLADSVLVEEWAGNNLISKSMYAAADTQAIIAKSAGTYLFSVRFLKHMSSASGTWWQWGARRFDSVMVDRKLNAHIVHNNQGAWCLKKDYQFLDTFKLNVGETRLWTWGMDSMGVAKQITLNSSNEKADLLWLTLTNSSGCEYHDSIMVSFKNTSAGSLNLSQQQVCEYDSIRLAYPFNKNVSSFVWYIESDKNTIDTLKELAYFSTKGRAAGNYIAKFMGQDTAGCHDSLMAIFSIIDQPSLPQFDLYEGLGRTGDTMRLRAQSGFAQYWWNGTSSSDSTYWFASDTAGLFEISLKVANDFGCESETAYRKYPIVLNQTNSFEVQLFQLYPNPSRDKVKIESKGGALLVLDVHGRVVLNTELMKGVVELDLIKWSSAVYHFQMIDSKGNVQNTKLIKQ